MSKRLSTTLFALLCAGAPSVGQGPEEIPTFEETLEVRAVTLDVVVVDAAGNRVMDLGPEDFEVKEDGEPVEILYFSEIRQGDLVPAGGVRTGTGGTEIPRRPGSEPDATSSPSLRLSIFLDAAHSTPTSRKRFLQDVWPTLEKGLAPEDLVLLAVYDGSLRVVTQFTTDRNAVREGFEKASSTAGVAAMAAQEERAAIDQIRQRQRSAIQNSERSGAAGGFDLPCPGDLGVSARAYAAAAHSRAMGALSALQTLADSLAGFEGRKAIAHVSDGIPLVPGSSVYEYAISLCDGSGARSGLPDAFDVYAVDVDERSLLFDPNSARMDMQEFNLANELHRVASHANAHSVRMYTFDASGLGAAGTAAGAGMSRTQTEQAQFSERRNLQDPLIQLADETGGRALTDSNRFDEGLDRMLGDLGSYYSLGYRPRTLERNRALDVEVEVKGKGRRVIAPSTRRSKSQDERVVDRMLAAVFHGDVPNPLLAIAEARVEPGAGRTLVRIGVPMHRITLLPRGEHHEGSVTFFVSARADGRQGAQSVRRRTVAVRVASDRLTQALTETYTFGAAVEGDLTGQVLAVGVRDEHSGQASFLSTTVEGAPGR